MWTDFAHSVVASDIELTPHRVVASPDPRWHFVVLSAPPYRVERVRAMPAPRPRVPEVLFQLSDDADSSIAVLATLAEREVDPADWITYLLEELRYEVLDTVFKPGRTEPAFEVLARDPDGVALSHLRVVKEGVHLFTFAARAPEPLFRERAALFELLGESLFPLAAPEHHLAEPFRRTLAFGPGALSFRHPESWKLCVAPRRSDGEPQPTVLRFEDGVPLGALTLSTWPAASLESAAHVLDARALELRELGLALGPSTPVDVSAPKSLGLVVGSTSMAAQRHEEVRLAAGKVGDTWFCLSLLGPSRLGSPFVWMENKRAFDLALESLRSAEAAAG